MRSFLVVSVVGTLCFLQPLLAQDTCKYSRSNYELDALLQTISNHNSINEIPEIYTAIEGLFCHKNATRSTPGRLQCLADNAINMLTESSSSSIDSIKTQIKTKVDEIFNVRFSLSSASDEILGIIDLLFHANVNYTSSYNTIQYCIRKEKCKEFGYYSGQESYYIAENEKCYVTLPRNRDTKLGNLAIKRCNIHGAKVWKHHECEAIPECKANFPEGVETWTMSRRKTDSQCGFIKLWSKRKEALCSIPIQYPYGKHRVICEM